MELLENIKVSDNLSISASDISEELEKANDFKVYELEEINKMEKDKLNRILLEQQQKLINLQIFCDEVKKEKRHYTYKKEPNNINTGEELQNIYKKNDKLKKRIEDIMKINHNLKISNESQERVIEKLNAKNFIYQYSVVEKSKRPESARTELNCGTNLPTMRNLSTRANSNIKFRPLSGASKTNSNIINKI